MRKNARLRNRSEFVITPLMRITQRDHARKMIIQNLKSGHARQFPWTYFKEVLSAAGIPLEVTRWINQNDHRPKSWIKARVDAAVERYYALKVKHYTIPMGAYSKGTANELREFVATFREIKGEFGSTWRKSRYWYTHPGDLIINRDVTEPKTNGRYLAGATGLRFDDDFFLFAVLPYRYREIPLEEVIAILFEDVPISECEFIPDSGTPEIEQYVRDCWLKGEATRMIGDRHKDKWDDVKALIVGENIKVTLLRDGMVTVTATVTKDVVAAYADARIRRYG